MIQSLLSQAQGVTGTCPAFWHGKLQCIELCKLLAWRTKSFSFVSSQLHLFVNVISHLNANKHFEEKCSVVVLKPFTAKIKVIIHKGNETQTSRMLVDIVLHDVAMQVSKVQYITFCHLYYSVLRAIINKCVFVSFFFYF